MSEKKLIEIGRSKVLYKNVLDYILSIFYIKPHIMWHITIYPFQRYITYIIDFTSH